MSGERIRERGPRPCEEIGSKARKFPSPHDGRECAMFAMRRRPLATLSDADSRIYVEELGRQHWRTFGLGGCLSLLCIVGRRGPSNIAAKSMWVDPLVSAGLCFCGSGFFCALAAHWATNERGPQIGSDSSVGGWLLLLSFARRPAGAQSRPPRSQRWWWLCFGLCVAFLVQ